MNRLDPAEAQDLLWWLVKQGFTRHVIGPMNSPHVIVLFYDWENYIDVAHIRGVHRTEVARVPKSAGYNVYRPTLVVWHYWGGIVDALAALKRLPPPDDPVTPTIPYVPPRNLAEVPKDGPQEALTVDPDECEQVHVRVSDYRPPSVGGME